MANEAPSDDRNVPSVTLSKADFDLLVKKDEILQKLLEVSASDQNSTVISNHKFHDYLIEKPNKSSAAVGIDSSKMASSTHELNPSNTDQTESSPKTPVVKAKASPKPQKPHKSCDAVGIDNAKTGTPSHDLNPSATDQKTKSSSATPVVKVKASPKTLADKDKKSKPASDKNNKQISSPFYMNTKKPRKPLPRSATRTSSRIAGGAQCPRVQVAARRRYSTSSSEESSDEMTSANRTSVHRSGTSSAVRTLKLGNESQDSSSSDCDAKPQANALSTNPVSKTNRKRSRELETKAAHQGSKNADGGPDNRKRSDLRESRRLDGSGVGDHPGNPNVTRGKEGVKRFFSKTLSFLVRRRPPPGSR